MHSLVGYAQPSRLCTASVLPAQGACRACLGQDCIDKRLAPGIAGEGGPLVRRRWCAPEAHFSVRREKVPHVLVQLIGCGTVAVVVCVTTTHAAGVCGEKASTSVTLTRVQCVYAQRVRSAGRRTPRDSRRRGDTAANAQLARSGTGGRGASHATRPCGPCKARPRRFEGERIHRFCERKYQT